MTEIEQYARPASSAAEEEEAYAAFLQRVAAQEAAKEAALEEKACEFLAGKLDLVIIAAGPGGWSGRLSALCTDRGLDALLRVNRRMGRDAKSDEWIVDQVMEARDRWDAALRRS